MDGRTAGSVEGAQFPAPLSRKALRHFLLARAALHGKPLRRTDRGRNMPKLTLARANRIISLAQKMAREKNMQPLAIVVLDAAASVKAAQLQDGLPFGRFDYASGKARAALATGKSSRAMQESALERPHFVQGVSSVIAGGVLPVPGGMIIRSGKDIVGAVGISGDTSENDEAAATHGITGAGFTI